jgi:hypothetical protein
MKSNKTQIHDEQGDWTSEVKIRNRFKVDSLINEEMSGFSARRSLLNRVGIEILNPLARIMELMEGLRILSAIRIMPY